MAPLGSETWLLPAPRSNSNPVLPREKSDQELLPPLGMANSTLSGWPYHCKGPASRGTMVRPWLSLLIRPRIPDQGKQVREPHALPCIPGVTVNDQKQEMNKVSALMTRATHVAFVAPAFANSSTSSLDQHGDVSRDGQVTLSKQVTLKQCRDDDSCTHKHCTSRSQVRPDAAAAKSDSEKDHGIDCAMIPFS